ncbi:helix-turn-helix domain-containing protein [Ectobacillus panaciterrae]|uniref:helix-turn-helix domain-containing protein n=1 Tax=Ectobacillus panaciterrae TaxID=363872 RepID=UPI00042110B6|nr:helix-turn-helix domain-containing protein [Ectobacillus panaciterrae]
MLQAFDKRQFIRDEVLTTPEAQELLGISRARMSTMIKSGKITPIKKSGAISLFLREDLVEKKEEMTELRKKYRPWESE